MAIDAVRLAAGWLLRPHGGAVHRGCGGPVLDVESVHLPLDVEVVVRHVRVVGRRRDHDEPEGGSGGRRGRPAVDVMRQCEPGRVSKTDGSQSPDLQRDVLVPAGVDEVDVYHDLASGVRDNPAGLDCCRRAVRKGDVVVMRKLDRLLVVVPTRRAKSSDEARPLVVYPFALESKSLDRRQRSVREFGDEINPDVASVQSGET